MGKDCRSPLHQQCSFLEFPNFTSSVPYPRQQMFAQPFANSYSYVVSENGPLPGMEVPWLSHLRIPQENGESHQNDYQQSPMAYTRRTYANGSFPRSVVPELPHSNIFQRKEELERYFYIPNLCKSDTPHPDSFLKEKLYGTKASSNVVSGSVQKAFFICDQSDKTTSLSFSSLAPYPAQNLNLVNPSPFDSSGKKESQATRALIACPCPVIHEGFDENQETNEESEMHEDTEELNALLYSDSSECEEEEEEEEEEETSTAHSPGKIPGWSMNQNRGEAEVGTDEVTGPIGGAAKRKRPRDEEEELPSEEDDLLGDTASSMNASKSEDDAESSCLNGKTYEKLCPSEASKRLKRERIWDTMSILQSIVPGGEGKDSALILDEAIKYLRFLKLKAKSLGFAME